MFTIPINYYNILYNNPPKFYNNCDSDHTLIVELNEGDYTTSRLSSIGFFNSISGVDCINIPSGFSVTIYDKDNFQGNKKIFNPSPKNYLYIDDFNIKIMSLQIKTLPIFYTFCGGQKSLFSLNEGRYNLNDLTRLTSDTSLQLRSLFVPSGFHIKVFYNDNFENILLDVNGLNWFNCIRNNDQDGLIMRSIIIEI